MLSYYRFLDEHSIEGKRSRGMLVSHFFAKAQLLHPSHPFFPSVWKLAQKKKNKREKSKRAEKITADPAGGGSDEGTGQRGGGTPFLRGTFDEDCTRRTHGRNLF